MSRIFLGVDHGLDGAFATIREDGSIHKILRTPTMQLNETRVIDCFQVYSWLYENYGDFEDDVVACGEQLHAIFRASASSTFSFGKNIGKITGIIECLQMEYYEVGARAWQKHMFALCNVPEMVIKKKGRKGMSRDTKGMAKVAASHLWGMDIFDHIQDDGILDALLIAKYASLTYTGK